VKYCNDGDENLNHIFFRERLKYHKCLVVSRKYWNTNSNKRTVIPYVFQDAGRIYPSQFCFLFFSSVFYIAIILGIVL